MFNNVFKSLITLLFIICHVTIAFAQTSTVKVYINGAELPVQAIIKSGVAYLPAQTLAETLKIKLNWNPVTRQLKVNNAIVNTPPIFRDGALYVPVEALIQTLGGTLEWDGANRIIQIKTGDAVISPGGSDTQPAFTPTPPETINTTPPPDNTNRIPEPETFVPRTSANTDYSITVTNVNETRVIKEYYRPKPGYKFVIIHVSQQNISDKVQLYTGRFALKDHTEQTYEYIEGLSNFWLQILRPGGINFGSLVFELPANTVPAKLILHTYGTSPLSLNLK